MRADKLQAESTPYPGWVFYTPASHLEGPGSTLSQENVYHDIYFVIFLSSSK
jgi:hypothetical protein